MSEWDLYLLTRLDGINTFLVILVSFGGAALLSVTWIKCMIADENDEPCPAIPILKKWVPVLLAASLLLVATPTSKEMAAIYIIPKIATGERLDKAGKSLDGVMDMANQWIQQNLKKP